MLLHDLRPDWLEKLKKRNFIEVNPCTYEELRLQGPGTVVVYKSGKVLFQGSAAQLEKLNEMVKPKFEMLTIVGTDESLKGDTFGGIVVAGVKATPRQRQQLLKLGVCDSKRLNKQQIHALAERIKGHFKYSVRELSPRQYNNMVNEIKVTGVLNRLHQECFKKLKPGKHIVDKYPGCKVGDLAITKAEEYSLEVAAASIIARHFGLLQFDRLSKKAGFRLPLGSTHVSGALRRLKSKQVLLGDFAKLGFRNVQQDL